MATVLLSDPDERTRAVLAALIEALGHRVVSEAGIGCVDLAVVEPASRRSVALVERARRRRHVPVVCVSDKRRCPSGLRLAPTAYLRKPVQVGPFVRAVERALEPTRAEPATARRSRQLVAA